MKTTSPAALTLALLATSVCAQAQQQKTTDKPAAAQSQPATTAAAQTTASPATTIKPAAISAASTPLELARAAYAAQGGDKYRDLKNMVLLGSVDLYAPGSAQTLAGKFGIITSGDKMRQEVQSPLVNFSLVSDGVNTYTNMRGFGLPPASKFGMPILLKFDQAGYVVTALPDKKKERAFRITEPEGNSTDFYVDAATGRLTRFEVPYGDYTYAVEFKSVKEIEGVLVPFSFVQRISTTQGSFYAEYKVKEAKLNQQLPDNVFAIPQN